jgi:hypothetical protein
MSRENVELVRGVTDLMDTEGFEAALPVFHRAAHPDVEWREDPAWPGSGRYLGQSESRRSPKVEFFLDRAEALAAAGVPE